MHNHLCGCDHELAYCAHCDICFCKKCGREWGKHTYPYWTTFTSAIGSTIVTDTDFPNNGVICTHQHN